MANYADPKYLAGLKNLFLAAKTTVDGFMTGLNKSRIKGTGTEFSQYRTYQPGDDLRWLDWKMYARSDRYYIRESERETQVGITFMLDASASMAHEDDGMSKLEYAKYLIACLAYLATLQGDGVGLAVYNEKEVNTIASRQSFQHLSRLLHRLEQIQPNGVFASSEKYRHVLGNMKRKELVVFVTDMYQHTDELNKLLRLVGGMKNEVIVFHLMANNELNFDYKGYTAVEDLETGEVVAINSVASADVYRKKLKQHLETVKNTMLQNKFYYQLVNTGLGVDEVLRSFLIQRAKH